MQENRSPLSIAMKERIQKILANAGVASRRAVEEMIQQGRVAVNGRVMTELPILIDPQKDKVSVDDEPIKLKGKEAERRVYLLMNKPKGVFSTNVAQGEQTRAIDLLPPDFRERVYPVGRLDAESRGLLLLTNDGELTNQLTHPRYGVAKTYKAIVDGFVSPRVVEELSAGVWLADPKSGKGFKTGRSRVKIVKRTRDKSVLEITIREGRNRMVRRMLAKAGHKVRDLTRVRMGPLTLHGLNPGDVRMLTPREVRELKSLAEKKPPRRDGGGGDGDAADQSS
jgi:pseudouridine synthase